MTVMIMVRAAGLLVVGFVAGLFGTALYTDTTISNTLSQHNSGGTSNIAVADTCTPDPNAQEGEIYFLSCGGIF